MSREELLIQLNKLKADIAEKDALIYKLGARPQTPGKSGGSAEISKGDMQIEHLKKQIHVLHATLSDKDDVIKSLQRQVLQSHSDKGNMVKDSIEMVIKEKDSEIRRLRALWSPSDKVESADDIKRATNLVNAREVMPGKKSTRFGISAENRKSVPIAQSALQNSSEKTSAQRKMIRKAFGTNVFMKNLDYNQIDQLIGCMTMKTLPKDSVFITEGEYGTHMYVLESGQAEVFNGKGSQIQHVVDLKPGAVIGELAVLYNCRRTASVRALSEVTLWCLQREAFQDAIRRSGKQKRQQYIRLLKTVENFKTLSDNKLMRIADCLDEAVFKNGDYIIRQGDPGDTFYIIQIGQVKVTHTKTGKKGKDFKEEFVCNLKPGEYFGESALLTEEKRSANIIADSTFVTVLMLDRKAFNALLGLITEVARTPSNTHIIPVRYETQDAAPQRMLQDYDDEEDEDVDEPLQVDGRVSESSKIAARISKATENVLKKTSLDQLKTIKVLGQGGFGCVKLVTVPGLPKCAFALKGVRKARIVQTGQEQHIIAEKNILISMKSPFIGRLYRTYRDDLKIYMLMDAYLGGEVYGVLQRYGACSEHMAKFVAGCVVEALDYLHRREIVYRDLKPENLIFNHKGYVKLIDFGFAKRVQIGYKTWTFCGTPEYFPPEILANLGHDVSADFWSFGVLVYELLTRSTPFFASNDMQVYENILSGIEGVRFSKRVTKNAELLVRSLCKQEPRERLGYQKGGMNDIRKHRWFQGFDWQGLRAQRIVAPYVPDIKSPTDGSNFNNIEEDNFNKEDDRKVLKRANMDWEKNF